MPEFFNPKCPGIILRAQALRLYSNENLINLYQDGDIRRGAIALIGTVVNKYERNIQALIADLHQHHLKRTHAFYLAELALALAHFFTHDRASAAKYYSLAGFWYGNLLEQNILVPNMLFVSQIHVQLGVSIEKLIGSDVNYACNEVANLQAANTIYSQILYDELVRRKIIPQVQPQLSPAVPIDTAPKSFRHHPYSFVTNMVDNHNVQWVRTQQEDGIFWQQLEDHIPKDNSNEAAELFPPNPI